MHKIKVRQEMEQTSCWSEESIVISRWIQGGIKKRNWWLLNWLIALLLTSVLTVSPVKTFNQHDQLQWFNSTAIPTMHPRPLLSQAALLHCFLSHVHYDNCILSYTFFLNLFESYGNRAASSYLYFSCLLPHVILAIDISPQQQKVKTKNCLL